MDWHLYGWIVPRIDPIGRKGRSRRVGRGCPVARSSCRSFRLTGTPSSCHRSRRSHLEWPSRSSRCSHPCHRARPRFPRGPLAPLASASASSALQRYVKSCCARRSANVSNQTAIWQRNLVLFKKRRSTLLVFYCFLSIILIQNLYSIFSNEISLISVLYL